MINIVFRRDIGGLIRGFTFLGHAGSAPKGEDLVCCAVSVLSINTVNSIRKFTKDRMKITQNEEEGLLDVRFPVSPSKKAHLLLRSLELGITELADQYESFISLKYTEV